MGHKIRTTDEILVDVLDVGIALSAENDKDKLFDMIIVKCMGITRCDAGTLYLCKNEKLVFKNMITLSQGINRGSNGETIDLPAIPYQIQDEIKNVSAYSAVHKRTVNIADVYKSDEFDFSGPMKYDALTNYRTQSMLVIPLKDNENEVIGVLQLINALDEEGRTIPFDPSYEFIISSLASQAAIAVANMMYVEEMKTLMKSFVQAMATAIDERTPYNGSHTRKVTEYASMIADYMNELYKAGKSETYFDENRKENLQLAASLHDIGKMIVPLSVMNKSTRLGYKINDVLGRLELICCYMKCDMLEGTLPEAEYKVEKQYIDDCVRFIQDINGLGFLCDEKLRYIHELDKKYYINKKGKKTKYITPQEAECMMIQKGTLTADERFIMESHVSMTAKILDKVHFSRSYEKVPIWAASHHEMMDGSGYPNHLSGDDVELETRILAAVDIYDALTSADRPYKKPMDKDKAFSVLNEMANEGKLDKTIIGYLHSCLQI